MASGEGVVDVVEGSAGGSLGCERGLIQPCRWVLDGLLFSTVGDELGEGDVVGLCRWFRWWSSRWRKFQMQVVSTWRLNRK